MLTDYSYMEENYSSNFFHIRKCIINMVKISDFVFFHIEVNYEQSKTMNICSDTTHIFKLLFSPTNEYEKNTTKSKFFIVKYKKITKIFQIFEKRV